MSNASIHADLMREMRTPPGDGFDPIPPSVHAWLMDASNPMRIRALGYLLATTIAGKGPEDEDGVKKRRKRTPYGRAESGPITAKHLSAFFDWELSNASATLTQLEQETLCFRDKGRVYLHGNVRKPTIKTEGEDKANETYNPLCTYNLPDDLRLEFERLDPQRRAQYTRDWISIQEHRDRLLRDAAAEVRAKVAEIEERWREAIGFKREKAKGRPSEKAKGKRPEPAVQIELIALPNLSVHISKNGATNHSAQNGNGDVYTTENGSAHNGASLSGFSEFQSVQSEVNPASVENVAEEQEKVAPAHPAAASSEPDETLPDDVTEQNVIRRALEERFGHKLRTTDTLPRDFLKLARQSGLNARLMAQFIHDKMDRKHALGYPVSTPGALLEWAPKDLPKWKEVNRTLIANVLTAEEREATARLNREARGAAAGAEPFDPAGFTAEMRDFRKKDKGGW